MEKVVNVRCGKPILKLKYRSLKGIQICAIVLYIALLLYCLDLVSVSFRIWNTLSVYINMVSKNGIVFPFLVWIQCIMCIAVNTFVVHYLRKAFSGTRNKYVSSMLFLFIVIGLIVVFLLCLICILILMHTYSAAEQIHDGIIDAMNNYSKDSDIKSQLDLMQIENGCCGSKNYTDWYNIKWYDANLINTQAYPQLKGETPFSCCSMRSSYPCIHHGVEVASDAYLYRKTANLSISMNGCHTVILRAKISTGWNLVWKTLILLFLQVYTDPQIVAILSGLRLIQTAHTERKSFDREDKVYTAWLFGCYAGKLKKTLPKTHKQTVTDTDDDFDEKDDED